MSLELFGWTIPEAFLFFSIALSVFACRAVFFGTRETKRLWKRMMMVLIFSAIAIGASLLSLHLRHFSYAAAQNPRERVFERYHQNLTSTSEEKWHMDVAAQDKKLVDLYDREMQLFEEKYGLRANNDSKPAQH